MKHIDRMAGALFLILGLSAAQAAGTAEQPSPGAEATTTRAPEIPLDELELLVQPLTREDLEVEAKAWMGLLKTKAEEISRTEIAIKYQTEGIERAEDVAEAATEASEALEAAVEAAEEAAVEEAAAEEAAAEEAAAGEAEGEEAEGEEPPVDAAAAEEAAAEAAADEEEAIEEAQEALEEAQEAIEEAQETQQRTEQDTAIQEVIEAAAEEAGLEDEAGAADLGDMEDVASLEELVGADPEAVESEDLTLDPEVLEEASKLEETAEVAKEVVEETLEVKGTLLEQLTELRGQRTALADRLGVVLKALEERGGETEYYYQYIQAVSGINLDVSDTAATWTNLKGWLTSKEGGLRWGRNFLVFMLTVVTFLLLSQLAGRAAEKALSFSDQMSGLAGNFLTKSIRGAILFFGLLFGLSQLEINIGPLLAMIGAAGFVVAFALQSSLSNVAGGLMILLYRPFDIGDMVTISKVFGQVHSMNLISTCIRTEGNRIVVVPNNQIWGGNIFNATSTQRRRVDLIFPISHKNEVGKALAALEDVATDHELVLKDRDNPVVRVHDVTASSVHLVCRAWVENESYWTVTWDLNRAVKERFDKEGITWPPPTV